jgi:Leucine-rich repeat (LRR) protein
MIIDKEYLLNNFFPYVKIIKLYDLTIEKIEENAFESFEKLTELRICGCKINKMCIANITSLKKLFICENYNIDELNFYNLPSLVILDMSSNGIKIIKNNFFKNLINLTDLDVSFNEIEIIEENSFSDLLSLEYLVLSHNKLSCLDKNIFKNLEKLKYLDLEQNKITSLSRYIFQNLINVKEISLKYNLISFLNGNIFINSKKLNHLNLQRNLLKKISPKILSQINISSYTLYVYQNNEKFIFKNFSILKNIPIYKLYWEQKVLKKNISYYIF